MGAAVKAVPELAAALLLHFGLQNLKAVAQVPERAHDSDYDLESVADHVIEAEVASYWRPLQRLLNCIETQLDCCWLARVGRHAH